MFKKFYLSKKEVTNTVAAMALLFALTSVICYFVYLFGDDLTAWQWVRFLGVNLLLAAVFGIYLYCADIEILHSAKKLYAVCLIMVFGLAVYVIIDKWVSPYAVPYALIPLTCGLIFSRKSGFISSLIIVMSMFFGQAFSEIVTTSYIPLFVGVCSSILSSYMLSNQNKRINYIGVAVVLAVLTCLSNLMLTLAVDEEANLLFVVVYSLLSGLVSVALFMLVVPVLDSIFNFVTDFRLAELTATDAPLMKRMFEEAPGTFNHCLTVANYTEACASAIGANTYLARAAAYYHDIGKLKNPQYYSENQTDGHNPHDEITPELSTSLIKKHVSNGLLIAKEYRLPDMFGVFIKEHHGTMPIQFFYSKAQKYTDGTLDDTGFRYDGPTPSNKISAILMICDASEAALRALSVDDRMKAEQIVGNIINDRLKYHQFDNCDITMKELNIIKETIVTVYVGISHKRIVYPNQKKNDESKAE